MGKAKISEIVPSNVTVGEPKIVELHKSLGGKQALPGSPAGVEAKPNPKIAADFKAPGVPGSN